MHSLEKLCKSQNMTIDCIYLKHFLNISYFFTFINDRPINGKPKMMLTAKKINTTVSNPHIIEQSRLS